MTVANRAVVVTGANRGAFALDDGAAHRVYSASERGVDGLWDMRRWLDRARLGRNETGFWWRCHDEYGQ
jgi:predicted dithiol-disulfide oxidoreductase (DUF899 family)